MNLATIKLNLKIQFVIYKEFYLRRFKKLYSEM